MNTTMTADDTTLPTDIDAFELVDSPSATDPGGAAGAEWLDCV